MIRCWESTDPLYLAYHDEEWGVPSHDERHLFEMLVLEGAQAGLSWSTILHKREGYRRAFAGFDVERVASGRAALDAAARRRPDLIVNWSAKTQLYGSPAATLAGMGAFLRANRCATRRQAALWHTCRRTPYPRQGVRGMDVPKGKPKGEWWKNYLRRRDLPRRLGISSATIARRDARGELPPSIFLGDLKNADAKWRRRSGPASLAHSMTTQD